ncbi:hypothetical protein ACN42_g11978 [Penicillium freii]|uniref:Uncharacterized protein n=1 Tax=Penicillium freii TaxID=48697 RepID=A0A101M7H3_PENFR|nr:hypothetical protein ACN42_g11978 [Penicillium freii]
MSSQHPDARGGWKPKPLSALRRPSSLLKSANPSAPPNRTTPHPNDEPLHQIPITYSTIAARALSFHRQVLTDVTPLQLAQNGLYCKPSRSGGSACCFACGSTILLYTLQDNPIEEMQQLHLANCIWQIICRDLKPTFERPNMVTPSDTASPSQRPPPESAPASILPDEPSTMNIDIAPEQSTTIPEPGPQQPQPTCSSEVSQPPQPLYSTPPVTSTPDQQPTYASVLQRPKLCLPQPTSNTYQSVPSPERTLTIEDLYRRFHNKPSPFQLNKKTSKSSASRARNKKASASQSLARFLISALPAFSRLLAEMQPAADDCWRPYRGTHYSRAMKAA